MPLATTSTSTSGTRSRQGHRDRPGAAVLALVVLLLTLLLGACSASNNETSAADGAADAFAGAGADAGSDGGGSGDAAMEADGGAAEAATGFGAEGSVAEVVRAQVDAAPGRMIARDATVGLVVEDVSQAATKVRAAAQSTQGYVVSEDITPAVDEDDGSGYALLVLSVPSESLDQAVDQVSALGTVISSTTTSQDVTERYVDTTARVETLQASVDRVRSLLDGAGSIKDIVALERELSERESELDALRAVQQSLEADVSRSSLTVEMRTDESTTMAAQEDPGGFVAGLRSGWSAFGTATAALLTGVGALLPFGMALTVLLGPVLWWYRRHGRRRSAVVQETDQLPA